VQRMGGEPAYFSQMEKTRNLPAGLLYAQEMVESHGDINAVSPRGAQGPFQMMPATSKQYGLADPFNLHDSADAASRMMGDLMKRYGGDIRKALAAYNWGQRNLDKDIAAHGSQWEGYAPRETRDYINKITAALAKQKVEVNVKVTNSTASRVAVQANAAGM
jgi:soluble lytic murein transglycosylase-like protein